jgi:hypothetical protein
LKIANTLYPTSKGKPPAAFGFTAFHHWRIKAMETPDRNFGPHPPGLISEITPESEWHRPMPDSFPPGTAREVWTILFGTTLPEEFKPPSLAELKVLWRRLRADARRLETRLKKSRAWEPMNGAWHGLGLHDAESVKRHAKYI